MSGWLVAAAAAVVAWATALGGSRVRRLDRLHVRLDGARAALESALGRRHRAARSVAAELAAEERAGLDPTAAALRSLVDAATAVRRDREAAENRLGRLLAGLQRDRLPADLRAELVEAEQFLAIVRRVHNDAVRDTLGLRSRRMVRWLHLAGTAPMPAYFEIADPPDVTATAVARETSAGRNR